MQVDPDEVHADCTVTVYTLGQRLGKSLDATACASKYSSTVIELSSQILVLNCYTTLHKDLSLSIT